ncbi:MAG: hypothetical protein ACXIUZ_02015 [Lysobacteraceae bacterium]
MAIASVALSAAGMYAQNQQSKATAEALGVQRKNQAEELRASAENKMGERVKAMRRERGRIEASAAGAGIAGNSFEASLNNALFEANTDLAKINLDHGFADRASERRFQNNLAQLPTHGGVQAGLQLAQAGASGYQAGGGNLADLKMLGGGT